MDWLSRARLRPIIYLWLGMMLSSFLGNCFAQNLPPVQNQINVNYKDIFNGTYSTQSNIVITPVERIITNLRIVPPHTNTNVGSTFSVEVVVESVRNLRGYQFDISFDPDILKVVSVTEGALLGSDGTGTFWIAPTITPGLIDNIANTRLGTNTGGISGTGTLAIVQFKAKKFGTSTIDLQEVKLLNSIPSKIPTNIFNGLVSVEPIIDLWVLKYGSTTAFAGGTATYFLIYGNKGTDTAQDVELVDIFPPQMEDIITAPPGFIYSTTTNRGTLTISTLTPGTYSFTLQIRIKPDTPGSSNITNRVSIKSRDIETDWANNYASATTHILIPTIDLWVVKRGQTDVIPGKIATYTITYGNRGNTTAYGVVLVDQFPMQMEALIEQNSGYFLDFNPITKCGTGNIDILPPGTYSFNLSIRISQEAVGSTTIYNAMSIKSPNTEIYYPNNYSTAATHIKTPEIDLWVQKQGPASAIPGAIATYTITYGNYGSETAGNVLLTDKFPEEMDIIATQTSGFAFMYDNLTKRGTWNVGNVTFGTYSFELAIKIKANTQGSTTLVNTMRIAYLGIETNHTNNQATASIHITDADLEIIKYGPSWTISEQNITYTIYYRKKGNTPVWNVTISDYLPGGVKYVSDTSGGTRTVTGSGTPTNPQIITQGSITPMSWWQSFQVTVFVTEDVLGTLNSKVINNVVEVKGTSLETNYTNNRATLTTTVEAARADVSISKDLYSSKAIRGYETTYMINCYNNGNIEAENVSVTDHLPEGLKYVSNTVVGTPNITGSITSGGEILTWNLGTFSNYASKKFLLTVLISDKVFGSSTIHNIATISTTSKEKDYTNNRATCTTHVDEPKINLWISKSGPNKINSGHNTIKYWISYGNYGKVEVGSVTIVDTLFKEPATASGTILYATDTSGFVATQTANQITWFVGTVNPLSYNSFQLTLVVTKDEDGNYVQGSTTLINDIRITGVGTESNLDNNHSSMKTHVKYPQIDLDIRKSGPSGILAGRGITYQIRYRNLGSVDAGSVTITDTLPPGVSYASDTSGFMPFTSTVGSQTQVCWEVGTRTMAGNNNWVIFQLFGTVSQDLPASTILANRIEISTPDAETNYGNNVCTWTTHILPPTADLRLTKYKVSPSEVTPGCELKYYLGYNNYYGNVPATNTVLIDTLPGSVTFDSCTGNGTLTTDGKVKWNIGTVTTTGDNSDGGFYLKVKVNNDVPDSTSLTNVAEITADTPDLDYTNNRATCTVHVVDWYADVRISKYGPYDIQPEGTLTYSIRYNNNYGNIPATNTVIIDTLPSGVIYATDTSGLPLTIGSNTLTWTVGTLPAGLSGFFYLYGRANKDLKGSTTITNRIEIRTSSYEKGTVNNRALWRTHIIPKEIDLRITKSGPQEVAQGQEFEYRITLRNLSQAIAEDVKVTDILPLGLIYLRDTSGITPATTTNIITWEMGNLPARYYKNFSIRVWVKDDVPASSTLTNIIEVSAANFDTNYTNNRATYTTHICLPEPDLKIRKWQRIYDVTAGQKMNYFVQYRNDGKGKAENVTITDYLPEWVTYVSDNSGLSREVIGNRVIWQVGTLNPGGVDNFRLTVYVDKYVQASTTLTNVIEITSSSYEDKDRATCTTHVAAPIADVLIYKWGPDEVLYGTEFNYEITYNNNSANDADGVVIKDILDPQLIYVSDTTGITPTINGNEISWYIGTMSPWASGNFLLRVTVPQSVPASSTLTNVIEITTLTRENNNNNNRATATTHVDRPKVDVGIEKKGDDARPGFIKRYHVTYYNHGTLRANDVIISDKLPQEVQYLSSSPAGNYNSASHTITWNIGDLEPQITRYITIEVKIPATQLCGVNLYNYIEITTTSPEYDYTNNNYTEIETVVTSIDPNDKLVSPQKYIQDKELLNYTIRFENQATATASAILITIEDRLDANLDWTTMKFDYIKIGQGTYTLENFNRGSLSCSYDVGSGTIRWEFDFKTGTNGLPPNVVPPEGEGEVNFNIRAKTDLPAGTEITNIADIRFDYNPVMQTPPVTNIVDRNKPTSTVALLSPEQTTTSFVVHWSGTDTTDGNKAGEIESYTVYVSDNGGTFTEWLERTLLGSSTFTGKTGHTYAFCSVAKDRAGNIEEGPTTPEATTILTLARHFVLATLTTTEMCVGGSLTLEVAIYDAEGNAIDYVGTATLRDKLGIVGEAIFNGRHSWTGEVTILQMPNGGTDTITVEASGIILAVTNPFLVLIDRYVGGTVTLFTSGIGTTTVRFGTGSFIQTFQNFYVVISPTSTTNTNPPVGSVVNFAREITAYNNAHI